MCYEMLSAAAKTLTWFAQCLVPPIYDLVIEATEALRYRAGRATGAAKLGWFRAAVEDSLTGETIRVANAALALDLARLLNTADAGEPLPRAGAQHYPPRFQVDHDPVMAKGRTRVVFVHGMSQRPVASAPDDEVAEEVVRVLSHVELTYLRRRSAGAGPRRQVDPSASPWPRCTSSGS
jgi:hypothetical protein